jgi:hypothetical protein
MYKIINFLLYPGLFATLRIFQITLHLPGNGAWYISEVMEILTKNPEIWKERTIFILTYDENDGYFDHVPPFVAPHRLKKRNWIGLKKYFCRVEYVSNESQQSIKRLARAKFHWIGISRASRNCFTLEQGWMG